MFGFIFLGYKEQEFYWELVVLSRKAAISLIGVTFAPDQRSQCMFGMLMVFLSTIAHTHYKPFCEDWLNRFEFASLASSAATFFFGMFTLEAGLPLSLFLSAIELYIYIHIYSESTHCP